MHIACKPQLRNHDKQINLLSQLWNKLFHFLFAARIAESLGYIWTHNDRDYLGAEFGRNSYYWKSRLRTTGYSWAYSALFEIGPVSEERFRVVMEASVETARR